MRTSSIKKVQTREIAKAATDIAPTEVGGFHEWITGHIRLETKETPSEARRRRQQDHEERLQMELQIFGLEE